MPSVSTVLAHWSYGAIFLTVVLGNVGLPVPEETVLVLAGYAVWRGDLHGPTVLAVGVVSAVVGDNLGYWLGRRYGRLALERYGPWVGVTADRLRRMGNVVARYGRWAVLFARFVAGFRVLAGALVGATGLSPTSSWVERLPDILERVLSDRTPRRRRPGARCIRVAPMGRR